MDLNGQTVLITGAASGIGRGTARRFAERGARRIACLDVHEAGLMSAVEDLRALDVEVLPLLADLGQVDQIRRAFAELNAAFGRLDAAALIGGYSWRGETLDVTPEQWDHMINVNLRGAFFCCQEALRIMYPQGSGAIVTMSADAAFFPIHGFAVQAAGKGGIAHMTQTLGLEAARRGVRVNSVSPGIVRVQPTGAARPPEPQLRRDATTPPPQTGEDLPEQTAAGRWNSVEQVADTIVFLCSEAGSGINGQLIHVNGGGYFSLRY